MNGCVYLRIRVDNNIDVVGENKNLITAIIRFAECNECTFEGIVEALIEYRDIIFPVQRSLLNNLKDLVNVALTKGFDIGFIETSVEDDKHLPAKHLAKLMIDNNDLKRAIKVLSRAIADYG